ncbi:hypothetical protein A3A38_01830 [Candidatus Kaiserbacteria bacterium RIFCSPLOWO2_01_FULL_53_17]|uniref:AB hydrolase-1 domain-containing protein n=1 Tax=Candidatus Kaiserbacteria bacterium RIFCSPLOWO2_01_FULL_53_17 TaxID=1798511 RepID=A0A1F6EHD9_9BACT|nr:MAG: hypothetical protein A3A38_01830 [Candidatus Kaiserbacteria bacterium RIFCSPLOWO2_01_FULL_53_17]
MKQQVVVIHGGDSFPAYDAYLSYLKNFKVDSIDSFRPKKDWKTSLPETLGGEYDVLLPRMPNKNNARYLAWKLWFEKMIPFLNDEVILVGHSLGASFLVHYLSEEQFPRRIRATLLVAAPYSIDMGAGTTPEFTAPDSLALLEKQGGKILLYHSKDDLVVPFSELAKYQKALPSATARAFNDRQHFNQESFPELVADIQSL